MKLVPAPHYGSPCRRGDLFAANHTVCHGVHRGWIEYVSGIMTSMAAGDVKFFCYAKNTSKEKNLWVFSFQVFLQVNL